MANQNQEMDDTSASDWKQKMEAMQRLANALENTSPPLMNKNVEISSPAAHPTTCKWLKKLKLFFPPNISHK